MFFLPLCLLVQQLTVMTWPERLFAKAAPSRASRSLPSFTARKPSAPGQQSTTPGTNRHIRQPQFFHWSHHLEITTIAFFPGIVCVCSSFNFPTPNRVLVGIKNVGAEENALFFCTYIIIRVKGYSKYLAPIPLLCLKGI